MAPAALVFRPLKASLWEGSGPTFEAMRLLAGAESQTPIDDNTAIPTELYGFLLAAAEAARQRGQHQLSGGNHLRLSCGRNEGATSRRSLRTERRLLRREIQRLEADLARRELLGLQADLACLTDLVEHFSAPEPCVLWSSGTAATHERSFGNGFAGSALSWRSAQLTPESSPGSPAGKHPRELSIDSRTTGYTTASPSWEPVLLNISYKTQDGSNFLRHGRREADRRQDCCPKFSTLFGRGRHKERPVTSPPLSCSVH